MPLAATAREGGDAREVRRVTRMGLWLSMGYAALLLPVLLWSGLIFSHLGQEPEVADLAGRYLGIAGWGIFPTMMIAVLRSFLSALERASVLMWSTILAAILNAIW